MNIQILGTKKNADTRKAERFFKERGIKFQSIDLKEKGLSKGELQSVVQAVGGIDIAVCYSDASKAERELGWKAKYDIVDMCRDSWNWQSHNPDGYR